MPIAQWLIAAQLVVVNTVAVMEFGLAHVFQV